MFSEADKLSSRARKIRKHDMHTSGGSWLNLQAGLQVIF